MVVRTQFILSTLPLPFQAVQELPLSLCTVVLSHYSVDMLTYEMYIWNLLSCFIVMIPTFVVKLPFRFNVVIMESDLLVSCFPSPQVVR